MKASTIMFFAIGASVFGRWTHNEPTASAKTVVQAVFAVLVIAFLDQGETEPVAKGLAWLVLASVLLGNKSPITGLANLGGAKTKTAAAPKAAPTSTVRSV